jgi:hypothetical protein
MCPKIQMIAAKPLPRTCPYGSDQIVSRAGQPQGRHGIVDDEDA